MNDAVLTFLFVDCGINVFMSFCCAFTKIPYRAMYVTEMSKVQRDIARGRAPFGMRLFFFAYNFVLNFIFHWPMHLLAAVPATIVFLTES